jgi:hypothetical protein
MKNKTDQITINDDVDDEGEFFTRDGDHNAYRMEAADDVATMSSHNGAHADRINNLIDVDDVDEMARTTAKELDQKAEQAKANPGKLIRIRAGWYLAYVNGTLWDIDHYTEDVGVDTWYAKEYYKGNDYLDNTDTLYQMKAQLGIS